MRNRFFVIILAILFVTSAGAIALHSWFLQKERFSLIDRQVRDTAVALIDSKLGRLRRIDFALTEKIISDELGENRIGKFFIIRDESGNMLFDSVSSLNLPIWDVPTEPQWLTFREKGQYIRIVNLKIPSIPNRTLQVGIVIDEALIIPSYFTVSTWYFMLTLLALGSAVAWLLTSFLLSPIRQLEKYVSQVSQRLSTIAELPTIPHELKQSPRLRSPDEFHRLSAGFATMVEKLNRNHKVSRLWAYQMAHEMKTPLAHIEIEIENGLREKKVLRETAAALSNEVASASEIIISFLSWAELENSARQKHLFANRIGKITREIAEKYEKKSGRCVKVEIREDFLALASPSHIEQLIQNLLSNALKYSPASASVELRVERPRLIIKDFGTGIPNDVLECVGEPFNRGINSSSDSGHGLGLAWVTTLSRIYGWDIDFNSGESGTTISIHFSEESEIPSSELHSTNVLAYKMREN